MSFGYLLQKIKNEFDPSKDMATRGCGMSSLKHLYIKLKITASMKPMVRIESNLAEMLLGDLQ